MVRRSVQLRPTHDDDLWDGLVRSSAGGLKFHEWAWLDLQEQVLGGSIDRLLVQVDEQPVGVFPVPRQGAAAWSRLPVPFPFLGPIVPAQLLQETLKAFRRYQLRFGPVVSRVDLGPSVSRGAREATTTAGCRAWEETTVMIDLAHGSMTQLEASFSKMRRRSMRRAVRDGASVREAVPEEVSRLLPRLLDEAYAAHDVHNPYPERMGRLVEEWTRGRDDIAAFTGSVNGEPAGMQVVLGDGETALYWVGATWRRFRSVDVTALLYRRCLEWSIERGCHTMDLCGSVDDGVLNYKLSFGGVERTYLSVESSALPAAALDVARSLRGRVARGRSTSTGVTATAARS